MRRDLESLAGARYDVAIVGGGIYGACAAWEAARRGLSVCLLERDDFGGATSANSLRIVHGGLRYLQHGDLARMRQSIRERRALMDLAPHLVRPLPFAIPIYGPGPLARAPYAAALAIAELVGRGLNGSPDPRRRIPGGRVLSRHEMLRIFPGLGRRRLAGGVLWHDGQVRSTERLLLAFLTSAARAGAALANHAEVTGFLRRGRRVTGVVARDRLSGNEVEISAEVVVNAAGPWADAALSPLGERAGRPRFLPSKALNLLTPRISRDRAVGIPGPAHFRDRDAWVQKGSRLFFVVPWGPWSLIGTRHLPYDGSPDAFRVTAADVRLFLAEVNAALPALGLEERDVLAVFGGMLPRAPGSPAGGEVELLKRSQLVDHEREEGLPGLVTMVGTKWTTARAVAERAIELAAERARGSRPGRPASGPLAGGELTPFDAWLSIRRAARPPGIPEASFVHLLERHGTGYGPVLRLALEDPALAAPIHDGSPVIGAQVVHAARQEMALFLDDVVLRRTELGLAGHPGETALRRCAELMARELGWDGARVEAELERTRRALRHPLRDEDGAGAGGGARGAGEPAPASRNGSRRQRSSPQPTEPAGRL